MEKQSELTIKLSIDASEALETLANVKAELEQVIALQDKITQEGREMNKAKIKTEKTEEPCQRCENTECASNKVPQEECDCCIMTASQSLGKQLLAYEATN